MHKVFIYDIKQRMPYEIAEFIEQKIKELEKQGYIFKSSFSIKERYVYLIFYSLRQPL